MVGKRDEKLTIEKMKTMYFWQSEALRAAKESAKENDEVIRETSMNDSEDYKEDPRNPMFDEFELSLNGETAAYEVGDDKFGYLYNDYDLDEVYGALVNAGNDPAIADWTNADAQRAAAELWEVLPQMDVLTPADGEDWVTACRSLGLKPSQARKIYNKGTHGGNLYLCLSEDWD